MKIQHPTTRSAALTRVVTTSLRWLLVLAIFLVGAELAGGIDPHQLEAERSARALRGEPVPVEAKGDWWGHVGLGLMMIGLISAGRLTLFQLGLRLQLRPRVFINYRRDDSAPHAMTIFQYLERQFGQRNVFLDIDRLEAGEHFPEVFAQRLDACDVMIVVIGPQWMTLLGSDNRRRIDFPNDWVRLEIVGALERNVALIPVLVGGASLPKEADMPETLRPLIDRHAFTLTTNGFRHEMAGLARDIRNRRKKRGLWVRTNDQYRRPAANAQS